MHSRVRATSALVWAIASCSGEVSTEPTPAPVTAGQAEVVLSSDAHRLDGRDVARGPNQLIVATRAETQAASNRWGAEVAVQGNTVVGIADRQTTDEPALPVPQGGVVLSGHGAARTWLLERARNGATVHLSDTAVAFSGAHHQVDGVDVPRGDDALVVYRRTAGQTETPTNRFGTEVVVIDGWVTGVFDRERTFGGPTPLPASGYVLSGHHLAAEWLRANANLTTASFLVNPVTGGGRAGAGGGSASAGGDASAGGSSERGGGSSGGGSNAGGATSGGSGVGGGASGGSIGGGSIGGGSAGGGSAGGGSTGGGSIAGGAAAGMTSAPMPYPAKAVAVYHMMWSSSGSPPLANVPASVNVVNLAFAQSDPPSLVGWASDGKAQFVAAARQLRARGVRIVLSVGGAGGNVRISNRQAFVNGVMAINQDVPLDGLDWDLEGPAMALADVVWISAELDRLRGSAFAITMAPNGSNVSTYLPIAVALQQAGLLDAYGQQFYDAVVSKEAALGRIDEAIARGIPEGKITIGMMVGSSSVYWTVDQCVTNVTWLKSRHPGLRGGYLWEHGRSGTTDWANRVGVLLLR